MRGEWEKRDDETTRRRDDEAGRPGRGCKTMYEQQTQIEREKKEEGGESQRGHGNTNNKRHRLMYAQESSEVEVSG